MYFDLRKISTLCKRLYKEAYNNLGLREHEARKTFKTKRKDLYLLELSFIYLYTLPIG
jgi:hypothetical protein